MKRTVYQCETCGAFADHRRTSCGCGAPDYRPQGRADFYHDEQGRYRWRLESYEPLEEATQS